MVKMTCNQSFNYYRLLYVLIVLAFFTFFSLSLLPLIGGQLPPLPDGQHKSGSKLNSCERCRLLVGSFDKGLERTSRGKFEGGDTHWEENKLGSYANSEIRLTEIQEQLCLELSSGKDECHHLAEEYEPQIENWWFSRRQSQHQTLYDYLCLDQMKACCPDGHFGPECKPCIGYPDKVCSGRGYCAGNGSRDGTGLCVCDTGFTGKDCNKCDKKYFQSLNETNGQLVCESCDNACQTCRSGGPKGCLVCTQGFIWDNDYGCVDIDECVDIGTNPCEANTFCINTEGSFYCYQCDKACDGCNGDGPDTCLKCATNHVLQNGVCVDPTVNKREMHISFARYATYLGLCVATCIVFRNNIYIASVIGIAVAVYITVSEFTLKDDLFSPLSLWAQALGSESK